MGMFSNRVHILLIFRNAFVIFFHKKDIYVYVKNIILTYIYSKL